VPLTIHLISFDYSVVGHLVGVSASVVTRIMAMIDWLAAFGFGCPD
jgi:hypothetical protein